MLEVSNVTKKFNMSKKPLRRILYNLGVKSMVNESDFFYALNAVSFKISRGETVGIIGRNGAGKSTLLHIICGTLKATTGQVTKPKKIAALLELGAGFNPEYTGLENIYLNAALIGMSKNEIKMNLDKIIEFSELESFINNQVKTYSSGMFARLAFSIAVHSKPDLLIVDEALSVGDMAFQEKSINKMKELRDSGTPIFFVSHSLPMVRNFCTRAIWMEKGCVKMDGDAKTVCAVYLNENTELKESRMSDEIKYTPSNPKLKINFCNIGKNRYFTNEDILVEVEIQKNSEIKGNLGIGLIIKDVDDNIVSVLSTVRDSIVITDVPKKVICRFKKISLLEGEYSVSISVTDDLATFHYDRIDYVANFSVVTKTNDFGLKVFEGTHGLDHLWDIS